MAHLLRRCSSAFQALPRVWGSSSGSSRGASRYAGALHPEVVDLIKGYTERTPEALVTALPHAQISLLRHPHTGNKVYLLCQLERLHATSALRAGALVQLLQPSTLALENLCGFDKLLVGLVDATLPEPPENVAPQLWAQVQFLYARKLTALERQRECREQLRHVLPARERAATVQLLRLSGRELNLRLLQDDIVDVERGTVDITQAIRLTGGFDQPPQKKRGPGWGPWIKDLCAQLLRLPYLLTGRGEPFEADAAFRVAIREAPPTTRILSIRPIGRVRVDKDIWEKHLQLDPREVKRLELEAAVQIIKRGLTEGTKYLPEGLDRTFLKKMDIVNWNTQFAELQVMKELRPLEGYIRSEIGKFMAEDLAALAHHNLVTMAVVHTDLVPGIVHTWLGMFQEGKGTVEGDGEAQQQQQQQPAKPVAPAGKPGKRGRRKKS